MKNETIDLEKFQTLSGLGLGEYCYDLEEAGFPKETDREFVLDLINNSHDYDSHHAIYIVRWGLSLKCAESVEQAIQLAIHADDPGIQVAALKELADNHIYVEKKSIDQLKNVQYSLSKSAWLTWIEKLEQISRE